MTEHRLRINGLLAGLSFEPKDTLCTILRDKLDLIGTKLGCDSGDCGACTVLHEGQPILSCLSLASLFDEKDEITTIEGIHGLEAGELLLEAFDKSGALQCGFCQPGMILAAQALLQVNKEPNLSEIKEALSGNLCRCTGYSKIYLAVLSAVRVLNAQALNIEEALAHFSQDQSLGGAL